MNITLPIYQVDAFTDRLFGGNPAAVCPLERWLPTEVMQAIALENNMSETAFFVGEGAAFELRWFTPRFEVDLCGHATLATSHVIATHISPGVEHLTFHTASGTLGVDCDGDRYTLDFPVLDATPAGPAVVRRLTEVLGVEVLDAWTGMDLMVEVADQAAVEGLQPDFEKMRRLDARGVLVTARGTQCDFVSRFFAPIHGIPEDPVTGSAHCMMAPMWGPRLGKTRMTARQLSARGGRLQVELKGDRVAISGQAVEYMQGRIRVPAEMGR